jgi:hypothetical protein
VPETHVIPLVLFAAMGRTTSIKIFGQDYPTPDGTCIRDYVHVSDLADAHVAATDWLMAGKPSDSFNLGNGRGFSVAEVVKTSEKVTGRSVPTEMCAQRPGDPPVLVSDSKQSARAVGLDAEVPGAGSPDHACVDLVPRQNAQHLKKRNPYLRWPHLSERSRSAIKWTAKFWGWFSRSHHIVLNTERLPVDGQRPRSLAEPLQGEPLIPDLSMMGPQRSISNLTFSRNCSED